MIDAVKETVKREMRQQESGFLSMLLGNLGAAVLRNMLIWKGVMRTWIEYNNMNHMDQKF